MRQERDLTKGAIVKSLWLFALPLMFGNVLQQLYNLVDTWVVGRYLGKRALAAIGGLSIVLTILLYGFVRPLTYLLQVPAETVEDMVTYLIYVFAGFFATFCITILQVCSEVSETHCCHLFSLEFPSHLISDLTFYLL